MSILEDLRQNQQTTKSNQSTINNQYQQEPLNPN